MYKRVKLLKKMLKPGGMMFIQIDDNEEAYLKVMCDEVFRRDNYINTLAVKMSPSSGLKRSHKDKGFIKNKEYILVYGNGPVLIKPLYDEWSKYDNHYSIWFDGTNYDSLLAVLKKKFPNRVVKPDLYLHDPDLLRFIVTNATNVFRTHDPSKWSVENVNSPETQLLFQCDDFVIKKSFNPNGSGEFELLKSKNNGTGYDRLEPLSWNVVDDKITTLRGDFWTGFEKDMGNVGKEGKVKMPMSKKPERLIHDIISCCTEPGDLVLDSFLGSGTTAAVAHKMKRRWIGIEMGNHAYTLCKPRMDFVINGTDELGVTEITKWSGGGGYKFYELAPTLINEDALGEPIINKEYNPDMLAAAVALHEGFKYNPDDKVFWKQSKSNENAYLFVTTATVTVPMIKEIESQMADDEFLVIACKSFEKAAVSVSNKIKIKKIPQMLLGKCEFGKDNYDLNIVHPPIYEDEEEE